MDKSHTVTVLSCTDRDVFGGAQHRVDDHRHDGGIQSVHSREGGQQGVRQT